MPKGAKKYQGRKRGAKPKGGHYGSLAIRVADAETFDALCQLSPEERGAAIVTGVRINSNTTIGAGKETDPC